MAYRIEWRPRARKAFLALDNPVRRRVGDAVEALAQDPRPAGAKAIVGADGVLRIRAGDYRILYTVNDDELVVLVVAAGDRREITSAERRAAFRSGASADIAGSCTPNRTSRRASWQQQSREEQREKRAETATRSARTIGGWVVAFIAAVPGPATSCGALG